MEISDTSNHRTGNSGACNLTDQALDQGTDNPTDYESCSDANRSSFQSKTTGGTVVDWDLVADLVANLIWNMYKSRVKPTIDNDGIDSQSAYRSSTGKPQREKQEDNHA